MCGSAADHPCAGVARANIRLGCAHEHRTVRCPAGVTDWVIAVGVAATLLVTGLSGQRSATYLDLLGYALLAAGGLALVARRRAPVLVLAVTGLCAVGYQAAGFDVPAVAYLFAVYAAVRAGTAPSRWRRA